MAEDEKAATPEEGANPAKTSPASEASSPSPTSPEGDPGAHHASTASTDGLASSPSRRPPPDEWTASDSRGPLERADADSDYAAGFEPSPGEPAAAEAHSEAAPAADVAPAAATTGDASPPTEPSPTSPEPVATPSRWPIAAALLVGAVIGAGSAALVYRSTGTAGASDADVAALGSRIDALEKRPDAQAALADLSGKVAALQKQQSAARAPQAAAGADPEIARKLAALQTSVDELKAQAGTGAGLESKVAALEGSVAGMKSATATTQAGVASVEGQQKTLSDRVMVPALAVVADSLVQQIDRGEPYSAQVDALVSLGADPAKVAVLRENAAKGVPSAKILAAKFEPLAEPIAASSRKAAPSAGFVERLKTGMLSMVSVRRADDTSGDDLPSRVSRIRADLVHDDIAGALATWDALPPEAKARGGDAWAALAKTSADALAAARGLQHDAIVALGAKRS